AARIDLLQRPGVGTFAHGNSPIASCQLTVEVNTRSLPGIPLPPSTSRASQLATVNWPMATSNVHNHFRQPPVPRLLDLQFVVRDRLDLVAEHVACRVERFAPRGAGE